MRSCQILWDNYPHPFCFWPIPMLTQMGKRRPKKKLERLAFAVKIADLPQLLHHQPGPKRRHRCFKSPFLARSSWPSASSCAASKNFRMSSPTPPVRDIVPQPVQLDRNRTWSGRYVAFGCLQSLTLPSASRLSATQCGIFNGNNNIFIYLNWFLLHFGLCYPHLPMMFWGLPNYFVRKSLFQVQVHISP